MGDKEVSCVIFAPAKALTLVPVSSWLEKDERAFGSNTVGSTGVRTNALLGVDQYSLSRNDIAKKMYPGFSPDS